MKTKKLKQLEKKVNNAIEAVHEELINPDSDGIPFPKEIEIVTPKEIKKAIEEDVDVDITNVDIDNDAAEDYQLVRKTLKRILKQSGKIVDVIESMVNEGGEPRQFEVAGQLLAVTSKIGIELMQLHKTKAELNNFRLPKIDETGIPPSIVDNPGGTNIIFEGTTKDLLDVINDAKEEQTNQ